MGLPWRGRKRTVVGVRQSAQTVEWSWVRLVGRRRVDRVSKGICNRVQESGGQRNDSVTHRCSERRQNPLPAARVFRVFSQISSQTKCNSSWECGGCNSGRSGVGTHKGCPYTGHFRTAPPHRVTCRSRWIPVFTGMTEEGGNDGGRGGAAGFLPPQERRWCVSPSGSRWRGCPRRGGACLRR